MNDEDKMGTTWSVVHRNDGSIECVYSTLDRCDFLCRQSKLEKWKEDDRTAYTSMELIYNFNDIHCERRASKSRGHEEKGDIDHKKTSALDGVKYKPGAYPFHKKAKKKNENTVNNGQKYKLNLPKRPKYPNLPREPITEYEKKSEKIKEPRTHAMRLDILDKRSKNKYHSEWLEKRKCVTGTYILPIGDGKFYNGYYVVEKRDWYYDIDGRPARIIYDTMNGPFPQWRSYLYWYWNIGGGNVELDAKDDPGFNSDGSRVRGGYENSDWELSENESCSGSEIALSYHSSDDSKDVGYDVTLEDKEDLDVSDEDDRGKEEDDEEDTIILDTSEMVMSSCDDEVLGHDTQSSQEDEVFCRKRRKKDRVIFESDSEED